MRSTSRRSSAGTLKYQAIHGAPIPLAEGPAYSLQPATSPTAASWNTDNNGTEYLLSALDFNATTDNRIAVWALTNTKSLDTDAGRDVDGTRDRRQRDVRPAAERGAEEGPDPARRRVGEQEELLATNDDRMNQVVYAAGKLWSGGEHRDPHVERGEREHRSQWDRVLRRNALDSDRDVGRRVDREPGLRRARQQRQRHCSRRSASTPRARA